MSLCKNDGTIFEIPKSTSPNVSFYNFNNMVTAPFVIYCDMETYIEEEELVRRGKIVSRRRHVPISVAALTVCRDCPDLGSCPFLYTGTDCVDVLLDHLDSEAFCLKCVYESVNEPCHWYESQCLAHESAEQCSMRLRPFTSHRIKVHDHCHISGWYRFALCSHCNLTRAKRPFEVIVFFHSLSNYDSQFIVCNLAFHLLRQDIHVIPRNSERYLTFNYGCLHFKDSYQFLAESLATLVDNLRMKGMDRFRNLNRFVTRKREHDLMTSKGVFP